MIIHNNNVASVMVGDCLASLRTLPDRSVNCCVTSPPYFGLRDYGCDGQIGLEPTPDEFIARLVDVFREVRRTLTDDGTLWLNIGDSYAANRGSQPQPTNTRNKTGHVGGATLASGAKAKDLLGIPWMLAFALRADGWYLRQEIIWSKPNAMPESAKDRCTKAHEQIFLLAKSPRYYYDDDAIKEPAVSNHSSGNGFKGRQGGAQHMPMSGGAGTEAEWTPGGMRNRRSVWTIPTRPYAGAHFAVFPPALVEPCILAGCPVDGVVLDPFGGSGTTAGVALLHGRNALLLELNPEYAALMPDRVKYIIDKHPKPIQLKAAA